MSIACANACEVVSTEQVLDTCCLLLFYESTRLNRRRSTLSPSLLLCSQRIPERSASATGVPESSQSSHTLPRFLEILLLVLMSLLLAFSSLLLLKPGAKYFSTYFDQNDQLI